MRKITYSEFQNKIHQLIPGGSHTYSKGDDQFPSNAPSGITKGKGAWLWDLEGKKFLDCSMGLGSVTLGHAYSDIIKAVKKQLDLGVNFQRPSMLELLAAEKFLSLIPNHDMVKFAKNGSAVTTAAVKLARAYTGRDIVAFPGDHPFYSYDDWFIGKTLCNRGVPDLTQQLSLTFKSCDSESLRTLFKLNPGKIACIIMEPEKFHCGSFCNCNKDIGIYLKEVIEISHENGALVIFDEMVTGFKTSFPGTSTKYNLRPDLITWGKGIANGFSCSALTGIKEVMNLGGILNEGEEKVFLISTTHGAETHALVALIETIEVYLKKNISESILLKGEYIIEKSKQLINKYNLAEFIKVSNSRWTPIWTFSGPGEVSESTYRTYFLQEMINNKVLFQGALVPSASHNEVELNFFFRAFEKSLKKYQSCIKLGNVESLLIGKPIKPVFRKFI
jgi:glutamate-1-semialdehyde aminotransferase